MAFDIQRVKKKVLEKYPWFGGVASGLEYRESFHVAGTAGDGRVIFYNPDYMAGLAPDEQVFALAHEICHVAFDHIHRSRGKDREIWNRAADAVVNQLLKADGLRIPEGAVDFPEAMGRGVEEYYEELLEHKLAIELIEGKMNRPEGPGGEGEMDGRNEPSGDHSMWEDANRQEEAEDREKEEELLRELDRIRGLVEEMNEEMNEEDPAPDGVESTDRERDSGGEDPDEEEMGLFARKGSSPGNADDPGRRQVDELGPIEPIIDWRMVLRETVKLGVDWTYTFATLEDGIVRPSLEELPIPETEVVVDTSWSVDETLLRNFLRECINILSCSRLKIRCFDSRFYGFHEVRKPEDILKIPLEGGGGTDFNAAIGAFTLRVENKVIFTDGEADVPDEPVDAIWLIYGEKQIEPPGGRVIRITPEQMEKLNCRKRS